MNVVAETNALLRAPKLVFNPTSSCRQLGGTCWEREDNLIQLKYIPAELQFLTWAALGSFYTIVNSQNLTKFVSQLIYLRLLSEWILKINLKLLWLLARHKRLLFVLLSNQISLFNVNHPSEKCVICQSVTSVFPISMKTIEWEQTNRIRPTQMT